MLTLLSHARPRRVLEIGTGPGHMTANLTRWTPDDARVCTIDLVRGMPRIAPVAVEQQVEVPAHSDWRRFANHFGTAHKAFFITADTMASSGKWVLMQPWEFGSVPKAWLPMLRQVDEVWAYSRYVRDCYRRAGVPPERIPIIPLGVDPEVFRPELEPFPLPPGPRVRFLFVGGTIFRKGIDILLNAFGQAFSPSDGVGLVIKDMGSKSFYRGQTAEAQIAALRERGYAVEYMERDLTEAEMAALYTACNCLVHPFRGEGFGLPVIVTGGSRRGPLDYASDETAFLIPARPGQFVECRVGELETIDRPWLTIPALAEEGRGRERAHPQPLHLGAHHRCGGAAVAGAGRNAELATDKHR